MLNSKYENRLLEWRTLRDELEESEDPLRRCLEFWDDVPEVRIAADPYNKENWPGPWEMIEENNFCSFVKILAICYTLQLTERFSQSSFEINIVQDRNKQDVFYLLFFDTKCIGYEPMKAIPIEDLPKNLIFEMRCPMPNLQ